ncbi:ac132 [Oxyplax ochracea nucleopolyhedrovirus]|uniref:Ac132 n=1 Tax=Oxyplax ochracea nucleopolyhedrovirus TaxID=2083176 RepID=A0A2L0WTZ7_9ABAC|nr:ac132 [Oxyplax ochracea nucleopolyhedrovirus]AVA31120.1 ac132 [Oxyplax ochracea nucleopolyhedrovirus]
MSVKNENDVVDKNLLYHTNFVESENFKKLNEIKRKVEKIFDFLSKVNIFNDSFNIQKFIIVFANPSYTINYKLYTNIYNEYQITLQCYNVDKDILFKNENEYVINRLSNKAFKVQLEQDVITDIDTVTYKSQQKILKIFVKFKKENFVNEILDRAIIYYNILYTDKDWNVSEKLKKVLENAKLEVPEKK